MSNKKVDCTEELTKVFTAIGNALDMDMPVIDLDDVREEKVINSEPLKLELNEPKNLSHSHMHTQQPCGL